MNNDTTPRSSPGPQDHLAWIALALEEARTAEAEGEVPVGAIVLMDGEVIGRGHNRTAADADPSAHAEILALRAAARSIGDWRLDGAALAVTLEPCPMCTGALILARVSQLVYAAPDPRYGACGSATDLITPELAPHLLSVVGGVGEEECRELLQRFFQRLRSTGEK